LICGLSKYLTKRPTQHLWFTSFPLHATTITSQPTDRPLTPPPKKGEANRVIGEHQLNRESSRSHCVFTLALETTREGAEGRVVGSAVTLVDLAGSERVSKTRSKGLVLKEAGHINRSLHILEQVRAGEGEGLDGVAGVRESTCQQLTCMHHQQQKHCPARPIHRQSTRSCWPPASAGATTSPTAPAS
jgi:hypothetical protein